MSFAEKFFINSTNGWERIQFEVVAWDTENWVLRISVRTKAWDRMVPTTEARLVDDTGFTVNQVVIRYRNLLLLNSSITEWLANHSGFSVTLGDGSQRCDIKIERTPELMTTIEKPALRFGYETSKVKLVIQMVVDQSCIRELHESLSECLKSRKL